MPNKSGWIGALAALALVGMLGVGGCNGRSAVHEPTHLPDLSRLNGSIDHLRADCPGPGYRGRLRRDLTQSYADRQYLLDDGSLCRPRP